MLKPLVFATGLCQNKGVKHNLLSRIPQLTALILVTLFAFQNCDEEDFETTANQQNTVHPLSTAEIGMSDLQRNAYIKIHQSDVELEFSKGEILAAAIPSWIGLCLTQEKYDQILDLLEENPICNEYYSYPEGTQCSMVYTRPYIELFVGTSKTIKKLGEKNSGCPSQITGLCENNEAFESLIRNLTIASDFTECP